MRSVLPINPAVASYACESKPIPLATAISRSGYPACLMSCIRRRRSREASSASCKCTTVRKRSSKWLAASLPCSICPGKTSWCQATDKIAHPQRRLPQLCLGNPKQTSDDIHWQVKGKIGEIARITLWLHLVCQTFCPCVALCLYAIDAQWPATLMTRLLSG